MPFTPAQVAKASKAALDYHLKNKPIDQVGYEMPLLKLLTEGKKAFPGGKEFITEQLRARRGSNFQWYRGNATVTYNTRDPLEQAKFGWSGVHDGFAMDEDEMLQNGIVLTDDGSAKATDAEKVQLSNLLEEKIFALEQGFKEQMDEQLYLDGTQNVEAIAGLSALVSTTPAVGVVGAINRATAGNEFWRNYAATGVAAADLVQSMETTLRAVRLNGGFQGVILCGSTFLDAYRAQAKEEIQRHVVVSGGTPKLDAGVEELYFRGIPLIWSPTMDRLDGATAWAKRAYWINKKHITLRPAQGHDMIARTPPRVYNQYVHYQAMTWKGGLTINRANGHAVQQLA